ncbi:CLUMA_CG006457, isoform A [Clunio marinus]|uniref:CLUMA_CG006457, isoform A n=1 Tax=Clunio marinus TaxID=568069 RepID=A0A1J1HXY4_9DIPT|nr:CLUMA_CG006457, isoform A [Clunio marinus]
MKISQRFHQFECQVIEINEHDDNSIFEMTHRVVQEALGIFSNIEKFQKFIEQNSQLKTIFEMSLTNIDDKKKEKNLLIATNALQRNKIPAEMKSLMDQHVELMRSITKNVKHREFLDEFMRKEMEIVITNTFGLTSPNGNEFGAGIFPLSSFFNHSCSPNVMRITVENKLVFIVSRPIEENEQLFVCYRNDFMETSTESRKAELRTKYNFDCVCEACIENFPLLIDIKSTSLNKISPEKTSTQQFTEQIAKAEFKTNCEFINKNSKNFPNYEVCNLIKRNQSLLEYLANISSSFSW